MKKKLIITSLIIIVIVLILLLVKINQEQTKTRNNIEIIKQNYEELKININNYNSDRSKLINNNDYYQETFKESYEELIKILSSIDNDTSKITKNIENIDNCCQNKFYKDSNITNICKKYKTTYEKTVNTFINDINDINLLIEKYNNETNSNLVKYSSNNIKDYIDYDKDGKYMEKK